MKVIFDQWWYITGQVTRGDDGARTLRSCPAAAAAFKARTV
ncbi:hypothetical protein [Nonomuraea basaltis]|nr:hypothetical protein [Nonomuraea basaltis]